MAKQNLPHDHGLTDEKAALLRQMPAPESCADAADTFQQLSDPTRLRIFWLLCHMEECVTNIAAAVEMTDAAVSHHLRMLKTGGLVKNRRVGKEVHYRMADTPKALLAHRMVDDCFHLVCPGGANPVAEREE